MRLTLRLRLTLWYSTIVALTIVVFAGVAYFTVSSELNENLDSSLAQVGSSLQTVIRKEQNSEKGALAPIKRPRRRSDEGDDFAFLQRGSLRDYVGPLPVIEPDANPDPVWSAVYEHILFSSATYRIQVANSDGIVVWRSDNLGADTLPTIQRFVSQGVSITDRRHFTFYTINGIRYRLFLLGTEHANVSVGYPVAEIDATLRRLFALLIWSLPLAFFVSVVAGWFLAKRSLDPIDEITRSARRITANNLQQRLPVPPTNDEIARLTGTLNDMIARLETSFDRIRQFTADASHELKTPLAILLGEIEVALRRPASIEEYRSTLVSCLEEVERLTKVVQGLLDLSRADSGQIPLELETLSLSALVADIVEDIAMLADAKHISILPAIAKNVLVDGDEVRLHQAILNVIENAIKYTPQRGRIEVSLIETGDNAVLTVMDSGPGISADQLPLIFDRFYRVDKARSQDIAGTGLGLSITQWIVHAHNGIISASSGERGGTTFVISLPLLNNGATP